MNERPPTTPLSPEEGKALSDAVCDAASPFLFTKGEVGVLVEAALKCADALLLATGGDRV